MKEVITFWGGDAKVGTTMIAQSFAEDMAAGGNLVLLLSASGETDDTYIPEGTVKEQGLDELRELDLKDVDKSAICKLIHKHNGFDYIKGAEVPLQVCYFDPELINRVIIPLLENDYDYILIDGGHNLNYPLSVSSLASATTVIYILKSSNRPVYRLKRAYESALKLILKKSGTSLKEFIIVNDYKKQDSVIPLDVIRELFNLDVYTLPHVNSANACEATYQTLMKVNKDFKEGISAIVKSFSNQ